MEGQPRMSILADMERVLAIHEAAQARKKTLPGFPPGRLIFIVGAWQAFVADMARRFGDNPDLTSFMGVPVERTYGTIGFELERRAR